MPRGRLVVADDDALLREGIASICAGAGWDVVGQAGDADELERLVREHHPDLVVVDIRMPPTHTTEGLRAAAALTSALPEIGILLLPAHAEVEDAVDLLKVGQGIGYLLKNRV